MVVTCIARNKACLGGLVTVEAPYGKLNTLQATSLLSESSMKEVSVEEREPFGIQYINSAQPLKHTVKNHVSFQTE